MVKLVVIYRMLGIMGLNSYTEKIFKRLEMKSSKYFNAGVMFVDHQKWLKNNIGEAPNLYLRQIIYPLFIFHDVRFKSNAYNMN